MDFSRLMEALKRYPMEHVLWGVLTLDQSKLEGVPLDDVYRGLEARWSFLAKSIRRRWGRFDYHVSLEAHANGMPHLNLVLVSPELAEQLREHPHTETDRKKKLAPHWWRDLTAHCGFGWRVSLEQVVDRQSVASYVTKMEKGTVKAPHVVGAEVVKLSQLPTMAPKRTRRIRSSRGFLPPKVKDPDISGRLVMTPVPTAMEDAANAGIGALFGRVLGMEVPPCEPAPKGATGEELRTSCPDWTQWWRLMQGPPPELVHAEAELTALPEPEPPRRGEAELAAFRRAAEGEKVWVPAPAYMREAVRVTGPPDETGEECAFVPPAPGRTSELRERIRDNAMTLERFNYYQDRLDAVARGEDPELVPKPKWARRWAS